MLNVTQGRSVARYRKIIEPIFKAAKCEVDLTSASPSSSPFVVSHRSTKKSRHTWVTLKKRYRSSPWIDLMLSLPYLEMDSYMRCSMAMLGTQSLQKRFVCPLLPFPLDLEMVWP